MYTYLDFLLSNKHNINEKIEKTVEQIKKILPRYKDIKTLVKYFNLDLEKLPLLHRSNAVKMLSRMYILLKYSSILTRTRKDTAAIGGIATGLLLAREKEPPRFTMDADFITSITENEIPEFIEKINNTLNKEKLIIKLPISKYKTIEIGRIKPLRIEEKLGKKIQPLIFNTFLLGIGRPLTDHIYIVSEKENIEIDIDLLKSLRLELKKLGDIRVDGLKIALTLNEQPRDVLEIEVPSIGIIKINSPKQLIMNKIDILKTPLEWDTAPLSVRINWGIDIFKTLLDLRLLKYYHTDIQLTDTEIKIIEKNIEETMRHIDRIVKSTTINNTVFEMENPYMLAEEILELIESAYIPR